MSKFLVAVLLLAFVLAGGAFAATHYWSCNVCGKEGPRTRNTMPPSPTFGGKCPATPTGKHIWAIVSVKP